MRQWNRRWTGRGFFHGADGFQVLEDALGETHAGFGFFSSHDDALTGEAVFVGVEAGYFFAFFGAGAVDFWALRRFASVCLADAIVELLARSAVAWRWGKTGLRGDRGRRRCGARPCRKRSWARGIYFQEL